MPAISAATIQPIVPSTVNGGFDLPLLPYTDASAATYKTGALLTNSGGDLVEATDADPTTAIAGVAMQAGSNIVASHVPNSIYPAGAALSGAEAVTPLLMCPALPHIIFEGTFANGGNDAAVAATDLYIKYGLAKDSTTGFWYVDKGDVTTEGSVIVIGIKNVQDIVLGTTVGVRVFFIFCMAETIYA